MGIDQHLGIYTSLFPLELQVEYNVIVDYTKGRYVYFYIKSIVLRLPHS